MSTQPPSDFSNYSADAGALSVALDMRLAEITRRQDAGELTVREAADLRIEAMESNLTEQRSLRNSFFGE
jgi:hypothetical protein